MNSKRSRFYRRLRWLICIWMSLGLIGTAFALAGVRMAKLSGDAAQIVDFPFYYSLLSNLGILGWAAGSFIPLFSSIFVEAPEVKGLLRGAGVLTLVLLLDDFLLIHDEFLSKVLGLPYTLCYLCYVITLTIIFQRHRTVIIKQTEYWILFLGVLFLSVSVLMVTGFLPGEAEAEDSFKLLGIVAYSYYWIITSAWALSQNSAPPSPDP